MFFVVSLYQFEWQASYLKSFQVITYITNGFLYRRLPTNHNFFMKGEIMTIRNLTKEEILGQIRYLEQNISNGSVSYRTNRLNRLRTLRASLRQAS